ncbi:unknown [Prevotella sp. CAG:485]|nr:unknown [Prevotella sp. CAG:485]
MLAGSVGQRLRQQYIVAVIHHRVGLTGHQSLLSRFLLRRVKACGMCICVEGCVDCYFRLHHCLQMLHLAALRNTALYHGVIIVGLYLPQRQGHSCLRVEATGRPIDRGFAAILGHWQLREGIVEPFFSHCLAATAAYGYGSAAVAGFRASCRTQSREGVGNYEHQGVGQITHHLGYALHNKHAHTFII